MKRTSHFATLLFLLLNLPAISHAAITINIIGVVKDQNGDVVQGALVEARNLSSGSVTTAATDALGKYQLRGLTPGEYRVSATRAGFSVSARSMLLSGSRDMAGIDFLLTPGLIEDSVTVTTGKGGVRVNAEAPFAIKVAGATEIEALRPASVTQALAGVPNLNIIGASPMAGRLRLRGLTSNRLLMIVDGERLNNVRSDPASGISPAIIDIMQLESVEVLSGSGSSLYGSDAIAGTVNMVSREPVITPGSTHLAMRLDGDVRSNGRFWRGSPVINFSTSRLAVRASGSAFGHSSYKTGDQPILLSEVLRIGNFATELSNAVDTGVGRSFAVWELPAGGLVPNGQGHGFYSQLDAWLMASPRQTVRYRQLNNQHKNLGFAFLAPPYDVRLQSNNFRRLDKYGLRYEGHELKSWLPRLTAGFYTQTYSFPDTNLNLAIDDGSSWVSGPEGLPLLTGNISRFTPLNLTDGKSTVTSYGAEVQGTFAVQHLRWTTGIGYLSDSSVDAFSREDLSPATPAPLRSIAGRASTPRSAYRNVSWSNLVEYEPFRVLRLNASMRADNWRTHARPTPGFPLGTESAILNASFGQLAAEPGAIDVEGAAGILDLVKGLSDIRTSRTSFTGSIGAIVRLGGGVKPYVRWETSYREPGITERYLLRNFGNRTFSLLVVPNITLRPERGRVFEIGLKIDRPRLRTTLNYFRNGLSDFISNEFSPALFVPPDPQNGLDPISPEFPFHGVLYVQRANTARARIQGVESSFEASLSLGPGGSLTPFGSVGWLKGSNLTPDEQTLALIRDFYNRADTPIFLKGSATDAPMPGISPLSGSFGVRYSDRAGSWVGEYNIRTRARVSRVDPMELTAAVGTQYGTFASLGASLTQSVRVGHTVRRERFRLYLTAGIDNLANRLYFEPFQTAPAAGRSYLFGLTLDTLNLLRR